MKLAIVGLMSLVIAGLCAQHDVISVCDALKRRNSLNHKVVAVRGVQLATDEGAWLKGLDCGEFVAPAGEPWPTFIWLEMSDRGRRSSGKATELEASVRRINTDIAKRSFDPKRDRLWLTYVGVFETDDESGHHVGDAGPGQIGFGHLNAARAQLIVQDVLDPVVEHGGAEAKVTKPKGK